jgi:hypothetical protein
MKELANYLILARLRHISWLFFLIGVFLLFGWETCVFARVGGGPNLAVLYDR